MNPHPRHRLALAALLAAACAVLPAHAADDDALDLQATPSAPVEPAASNTRVLLELAAITARKQAGGWVDGHRASLDLRLARPLGDGWRAALSDRLDDIQPVLAGQRSTRNSLREAYVGWQAATGGAGVEAGRINQRHGPAYGFNPTDYFRIGATRTVVTADPVALRENRVGTFMLRGSTLWDGGGAELAFAPKLSSQPPSDAVWSLDLGATNARDRLLFSANTKVSDRLSGEALLLLERGSSARLGANFTGLVTDAVVAYGEWSTTRTAPLLAQVLGMPAPKRRSDQLALGLTWSLPGGLAITGEADYNGAGLGRDDWRALFAQGEPASARFFGFTQASQEQASKRAWLLYVTQKGAFTKQLDLTGFVRQNALDHSHLLWVEARYHWPKFDAALQWQRGSGRAGTEFGALPYRQVLQLLGSVYF